MRAGRFPAFNLEMCMKSLFAKVGAVAAVAVGSLAPVLARAAATGPDFTALTGGVDFTTTIAAVLAVAALVAGLYLAVRGSKIVLSLIRG